MKTDGTRKCLIKVATQENHDVVRSAKKIKAFKDVTQDKENINKVKPTTFKEAKLASEREKAEAKKKTLLHKAVQTFEDYSVSEAELTSEDDPSEGYWRKLAEKRGEALNDSLQENEKLKENIEILQEENKICKEMLDESRALVEVLQEMLNDSNEEEAADETAEHN